MSIRMAENAFVLNAMQGNKWGKEERPSMPFKHGEKFDLKVLVHADRFEVHYFAMKITQWAADLRQQRTSGQLHPPHAAVDDQSPAR